MRLTATLFAYLLSLGVVGVIAFFAVIILAGPHSGLLPSWLEDVVLALGWLAALVVPGIVALRVWRRGAPAVAGGGPSCDS